MSEICVRESRTLIQRVGVATVATPGDPLPLDGGGSLAHAEIAYECFGPENAETTVLVCHALTGDAHVTRHGDGDRAGWWETLVGAGKGIDTRTTRVISSNVLGGCYGSTGPTSINPETGERYGPVFPEVTIGDMVRAQARLLDVIGVRGRIVVVGGSIGGFQVLEWIRAYPERLAGAAVIASGAALNAYGLAHNEVARTAIRADGRFKGGWYDPADPPAGGLAAARQLAHLTYRTGSAFERRFGRGEERGRFAVGSYLDHKGASFVNRFDANSYLALLGAMDRFDAMAGDGLVRGLGRFEGPLLIAGFTSDLLFPASQSAALAEVARGGGVACDLSIIESDEGHDAFLLPSSVLSKGVGSLVDRAGSCARRTAKEAG